jgi:hypothetical protein
VFEAPGLFFAHPCWPVREAATTVLSSLVELDTRRFAIIESLFEDPNWRVCYGAIEAAFAVRHKGLKAPRGVVQKATFGPPERVSQEISVTLVCGEAGGTVVRLLV